jgi:hypothetical protein
MIETSRLSHFLVNRLTDGSDGKAMSVTGRGGPQGCETSRLPHFLDNRFTGASEAASPTRRQRFTPPPPRKIPGTPVSG